MQKPKVLVITLTNGENEFDECVSAIKGQKNVDIEHIIISGKNEFEAHKEFGSTWNTRRNEFDNLVKIDADSILMSDKALSNVVKLFENFFMFFSKMIFINADFRSVFFLKIIITL